MEADLESAIVGLARPGSGAAIAAQTLDNGRAWTKFQQICEAQGGMRVSPRSSHRHPLAAARTGRVNAIDNRKIAKLAKLAGAPEAKAAGVELYVRLGDTVSVGQPLCTVHANAPGEIAYALAYADANPEIIMVQDQ